MKIEKVNLDVERKLLTQLIVSDEVCKNLIPVFNPLTLKSSFSRTVGMWIREFYEQYGTAPKTAIQDVYNIKKDTLRDDVEATAIRDYLLYLSKEWEKLEPNNIQFTIDEGKNYLKECSLEYLLETVATDLARKDVVKAELEIANYKRIEVASGEGVSIIHDTQEIIDSFEEDEELLFRFPGAFGEVVGDLHRGDFLSFFGPAKRGKSWYLLYTAETAMFKGLKVVLFTLEMTKRQMVRRAWRSIIGEPVKPMDVEIPYFEVAQEAKDGTPLYKVSSRVVHKEGFDKNVVSEKQRKLRRLLRTGDVRIVQLAGSKATVSEIEMHLDNMAHYDNFVADVVVIDYADLLVASRTAGKEYRHKLDDIWKGLRAIAQSRNLLMVTASHTNKETFGRDVQQADSSEDGRKMNHITSGIGLNQRKDEAEKGVLRINQLAVREGKQCFEQAVVLQCLDIGKPCLDSKLQKEMVKEKGEEEEKKKKVRGK